MPNVSPKGIYWSKVLGKFVSVQLFVQILGFASGILLIRALDKQQYAYFTIANTIQGAMNVLADSGISYGVLAIGGKVWQERYRFGQLVNTGLQVRIYLAGIVLVVVTPILLWMLISNGASFADAILITAAVLVGLNAQLSLNVLDVVLQLNSQINRIQSLQILLAISRLILLVIAYFTFLNAAVAVLTASISMAIQRLILTRWATESIDAEAPTNKEDRKEIIRIIKNQLPNAIFYSLQGQITVLLITIFGKTQSIAEVGALGRLAVVFSVVNEIMGKIVLPRFARCQSLKLMRRQYWQIMAIFCLFGLLILGLTAIFSSEILWILGKQYFHLKKELLLVAMSTLFNSITATMWSINATKVWIEYSWLNIPGTLFAQILLLLFLDVSTVEGVVVFSLMSAIPTFLINAMLTYRGLFSCKHKLL